ncbi:pre-mRNA-splicing factor Rse1p [Diutina catenulata]
MHLYNLTLEPPSDWQQVVVGHFIDDDTSSQQLAVSTGHYLELHKIDADTGAPRLVLREPMVGVIWQMQSVRPVGARTDWLVLTSDSGVVSFVEYGSGNRWRRKASQPFQKNGYGRTNQGHLLMADPSSRCVFLSALQRNKLVYSLGPKEGGIAIGPPVELQGDDSVVLAGCALDERFADPRFVTVETTPSSVEGGSAPAKASLRWYVFETGLNLLAAKGSVPLAASSHYYVFALPFGGVCVCCHGEIRYYRGPASEPVTVKVPSGLEIVTHTLQPRKKGTFLLVQDTDGHVFNLSLAYDAEKERLEAMGIHYFDTVEPATSLHILRSGYLVVCAVGGDQRVYQLEGTGNDEPIEEPFRPKELENLSLVARLASGASTYDAAVVEGKIYRARPEGLSVSQRGVAANVLVSSPLPFVPSRIFTTKLERSAASDAYLVVSNEDKTLVLSLGEVVEEVPDSKLLSDVPTILAAQVGRSSVVQIHREGITQVKKDKSVTTWQPPAGLFVTHAAANTDQVALVLSSGELVYFEVDVSDDTLAEYDDRLELGDSPVTSVGLARTRASFLVVGFADSSLSVVSLQHASCLEVVQMQALSAVPHALSVEGGHIGIGLDNGVYSVSNVDPSTGAIGATRKKYVGADPVAIYQVTSGAVLISSTVWITQDGEATPLMGLTLSCAAGFVSEEIGGEAMVGISRRGEMVIFTVGNDEDDEDEEDEEDEEGNEEVKDGDDDEEGNVDDKGGDGEDKDGKEKAPVPQESNESNGNAPSATAVARAASMNRHLKSGTMATRYLPVDGAPRRLVVDETTLFVATTTGVAIVKDGEVVFTVACDLGSVSSMVRTKMKGKQYLFVAGQGSVASFLVHDHPAVELLHVTRTKTDQRQTLLGFQGRLLVGVGSEIRTYDVGTRQLLFKGVSRMAAGPIVTMQPLGGDRIGVGYAHQGVSMVHYDAGDGHFHDFAWDANARHIISATPLDHTSVAGSDRFGNVFVSSLDDDVSRQADTEWYLVKAKEPYLQGPPFRTMAGAQFWVNDVVVSMARASMVFGGGQEALVYFGFSGSTGILLPIVSSSELKFLQRLEAAMRAQVNEQTSLLGKDQLKFRGYYDPVMNVVDGDFVERFLRLGEAEKQAVATQVERSVVEVTRKINEIRDRALP